MSNIFPNIKPGGLTQRDLVDALYMAYSSLYGIMAKADADSNAATTTHVALGWTPLINTIIEDSKGNRAGQAIAESSTIEPFHSITVNGITDAALNAALYQWHNALETFTEQLDTDALTLNTYEAIAFTATVLQKFENCKGNTVGNGTTYTFKPGGMRREGELIECLYGMFKSIEQLTLDQTTSGLDGDATLADTNYYALWYTGNLTLMIENKQGNRIGVSR